MNDIFKDVELIESALINYLDNETSLINDQIQYRIITKEYPFYVYLIYILYLYLYPCQYLYLYLYSYISI